MDRTKLRNALQIASNIGLLIGLILVGIQIRQASDLTRYSLTVAAYQQETDHFDALMGENPAAALARAKFEPEKLTPEDVEVLLAYADWSFSMMRRNARLEAYGIIDGAWRSYLGPIGEDLASNPVTLTYLLERKDPFAEALRQDWLKVMQDRSRATPPEAGRRFIEGLRRAAKESPQSANPESVAQPQEP